MRDAHRIQEEGPWSRGVRHGGRVARIFVLVGLAFAAGRLTAPPPPPAPPIVAAPADAPMAPSVPPEPMQSVPAAQTSKVAPSKKSRERRPAILVSAGAPGALADGLLPHQAGVAGRGEFTVQVSSFASRDEARAFCQQLVRRGFHPFVSHDATASARRHQVRMGRFDSRQAALDYRGRLGHADIASTVVQVD